MAVRSSQDDQAERTRARMEKITKGDSWSTKKGQGMADGNFLRG
jgi:hypothetical protein